ncbi:MAG: hypothetical protein WC503_03075 [Candidatus Shapirobacteria bacterium]
MAKKDKEETKKSSLEELRDSLSEKSKGVHISILSQSDIANINEWVLGPSYDLNRILSGSLFRGIPEKQFTVLVGPEASFKSSFMALMLANAQKQGFTPLVIDTEGAWTKEFVTRWGIDPDNILYIYTPWISEARVILGKIIDSGTEKLAIAVDSLGGFERFKVIDDAKKGEAKADQGSLQKDLKVFLKMIVNVCKARKSIGFAGGHLYGNPSGYGAPEQMGGGKYLRLAGDIIISLKKFKLEDEDENVIGTQIKAVTLKNRWYPPFNEATVDINYTSGINPFAGMLDIALKAGIFTQGGAWFTHVNTGEKIQGMEKVKVFMAENTHILQEIEEYIKNTGYSTVNENVKQAEELLKGEGNEE